MNCDDDDDNKRNTSVLMTGDSLVSTSESVVVMPLCQKIKVVCNQDNHLLAPGRHINDDVTDNNVNILKQTTGVFLSATNSSNAGITMWNVQLTTDQIWSYGGPKPKIVVVFNLKQEVETSRKQQRIAKSYY